MPLRRFFARLGARHPVAYSNLTLAAGVLACMIIAVMVSVSASRTAARKAAQEGQMRERRAVCAVADRMVRVYQGPDLTPTGQEAGKAWRDLRVIFRCDGSK